MALDLNELPPEEPESDEPPSRFVWTVIFFVLTIAGIFAVLTLWPGNEPAQTSWFWMCVALYPAGIAAFIVLRRFSMYEGRRLDVQAWNAACKRHREEAFARESIPMFVLGTAIRVTEDETAELMAHIETRKLSLTANASDFTQDASITARWLEPAEALLAADDEERHDLLLPWVFDSLLDELTERLDALPDKFPLRIVLDVSGYLGEADIKTVWTASWARHELRRAEATVAKVPIDLTTIDRWLDDSVGPLHRYAVLLVSVSLQGMLDERPADGSAEAGVGLLLSSQALAEQHQLIPDGKVHRPLSSTSGNLDHALTYALRWANADPASLDSVWMTGLDGESVGPLHASLSHVGVRTEEQEPLREVDLDRAVGRAGRSAGWLAVACGVDRANRSGVPQLIVHKSGECACVAVVQTSHNESNNKESLHDSEIQA